MQSIDFGKEHFDLGRLKFIERSAHDTITRKDKVSLYMKYAAPTL